MFKNLKIIVHKNILVYYCINNFVHFLCIMIIFKPHQIFSVIKKHFTKENPIIVEVGAFHGQDSIKLSAAWPKATIHSFEPVPELYAIAQQNCTHIPNIHYHQMALSNNTGFSPLYISEKPTKPGRPSQANSLHKPKERLKYSPLTFKSTIQVPTITLTDWIKENNIPHIDILWLDTQGHEMKILCHSTETLKKITLIYTEVSFLESYEQQATFADIKKFLIAHNFKLIGCDFENSTDWFFGNALFMNTQNSDENSFKKN